MVWFPSDCEDCNKEYEGDCPVHGAYNIILDTPVSLYRILWFDVSSDYEDCNKEYEGDYPVNSAYIDSIILNTYQSMNIHIHMNIYSVGVGTFVIGLGQISSFLSIHVVLKNKNVKN